MKIFLSSIGYNESYPVFENHLAINMETCVICRVHEIDDGNWNVIETRKEAIKTSPEFVAALLEISPSGSMDKWYEAAVLTNELLEKVYHSEKLFEQYEIFVRLMLKEF